MLSGLVWVVKALGNGLSRLFIGEVLAAADLFAAEEGDVATGLMTTESRLNSYHFVDVSNKAFLLAIWSAFH